MSLQKKAIAGTMWTTGATVTKIVIQILRLSILTRLLEKSDFGLIAIVTVVLGFTQLFADMGVSVALFSKAELSARQRSGLYWGSMLLGLVLYVLIALLSPLVAGFYNMPELQSLLPIMGLDLIISTASKQFKVYKQKNLQFKHISIIDITASILSLFVAWHMASSGWGVYSLVFSTLFSSLTSSILIIGTTIKTYPLKFCLAIKENIDIYKVGFYQLGSQILDYFSNQIDILLIGKFMSTSELGVYNLIKQLANRIYTLISSIITTVATPILAKIREEGGAFQGNYMRFLQIASYVSVVVFGSIFIGSEFVLHVLYGADYVSYHVILKIISVFMAIALFVSAASRLIIISGRTDVGFKWTILRFIANPIFIYIGSFYGLIGIVISQLIYMVLFFPVYYFMVITKVFKQIGFMQYSKTLLVNLLCAIPVITILWVLNTFLLGDFLVFVFLSILVYFSVLSLLNRRILMSLIIKRS